MTIEPRASMDDRPSLKPLGVLLAMLGAAWVAALVLILVQVA